MNRSTIKSRKASSLTKFLVLSLGLSAASMSPLAQAATRTWTGGATTAGTDGAGNTTGATANWSGGALPVSGDTIVFSGFDSATTDLSMTTGIGGTSTGSGLAAFNVTQSNPLTFTSTSASNNYFRFANNSTFTISAGAGAVTFGSAARLIIGGGTSTTEGSTWTNDSSNAVTFLSTASTTGFAGGSGTRNLTVGGSGDWAFNMAVNSLTNITKTGTGKLTLSGANGFSGTAALNAGTVAIGNNSALGTGAVTFGVGSGTITNVTLQSTDSTARTIANALTISSDTTFAGTGNLLFTGAVTGGSVAKTLTVNNPQTEFSNTISGSGARTKAGSGTLIFSGSNSYSGATNVTAGTLTLSGTGSINSSSGITINGSGAKFLQTSTVASTPAITLTQGTLDGTGTVGNVTVGASTGGIVANGNGTTAKLTLGSLTFNGGGTLNLNVAGGATTTEALTVTNALTTSGTANSVVVNISPTSPLNLGTTYNLVGYGSFAGNTTDFTYGGNTARKAGAFATSGNFLTLTVTGDTPKWTGLDNGDWVVGSTGANSNWKLVTAGTATDYIEADDVLFDDTATGTRTINVAANVTPGSTTFTTDQNNYKLTGAGGIAGSGPLVKNGTGKVVITNTNTYTGVTTINGGTLQIGDGTVDGSISSTASITNNGTLNYNRTTGSTFTYNNVISGTGALVKSGSGTQILSGSNSYSGGTTLNAGTLTAGSTTALGATASTLTINGGSLDSSVANLVLANNNAQTWNGDFSFVGTQNLNLGTGAVTLGANRQVTVAANTLTVGGVIGDGGNSFSLTKAGAGALRLTASNSYSGGTTINAGDLQFDANEGLGSGTITINGGALTARNGGKTLSNAVTVGGDFTLNSSLGGGNLLTLAGPVNLSGTTRTITVAATGGAAISGVISNGGLIKDGAGNLVVSGSNTYSGGTSINAGTLSIGSDAALGAVPGSPTTNVTFTGNSTLSGTAATTTLDANRSIAINSGVAAALSAGGNSNVLTVNGSVSNADNTGSLNLANSGGTVVLAGSNNFAAGSTINLKGGTGTNGGVLRLASSGALGSNAITLQSTDSNNAAVARLELTGGINVGSNATFNISGHSGAETTADREQLRNVAGNNTFNGTIAIAATGGSYAINNAAAGTTLTLTGTINNTLNSLRAVNFIGAGDIVASGAIVETGSAGTQMAVAKSGAGTLTLSGSSSYTGATTVSAGKLVVAGSISGSSLTTVASGATLASGNNTTASVKALTASSDAGGGGTVAVGDANAIGKLNVGGAVTLGTAGTAGVAHLSMEIGGTSAGTGYDQVALNNTTLNLTNVNLDGSLLNNFTPTQTTDFVNFSNGDKFFLVIGASSVTGTFANATGTDPNISGFNTITIGGQEFAISYTASAANNSLTGGTDIALAAVPEPSTWAMMLGGAGMLGFFQRARSRRSRKA